MRSLPTTSEQLASLLPIYLAPCLSSKYRLVDCRKKVVEANCMWQHSTITPFQKWRPHCLILMGKAVLERTGSTSLTMSETINNRKRPSLWASLWITGSNSQCERDYEQPGLALTARKTVDNQTWFLPWGRLQITGCDSRTLRKTVNNRKSPSLRKTQWTTESNSHCERDYEQPDVTFTAGKTVENRK